MRKLLSVFLVALLLLTGCNQEEISENPYRLKTQILESYRQEGVQIVRSEYTYDDTGLIQTSVAMQSDGTPESKHITTLDEYGNELEKVAYAYASELARFGMTDEEPDSKTVNIYELKEP